MKIDYNEIIKLERKKRTKQLEIDTDMLDTDILICLLQIIEQFYM